MIKRIVAFLAVVLAILLASACGEGDSSQGEGGKTGTGVGDLARSFDVTTTDGERVSLDSLQGKPFVIYFFANW